jgi:hypothetical protein
VCHQVQLGVYWKPCSAVCLSDSGDLVWERTVKKAGNVSSSAVESVLQSMPQSVLENLLGVYMTLSGQLRWERLVKQARSVSASAIGSVLESVLDSFLRAGLGAYSQTDWECAI